MEFIEQIWSILGQKPLYIKYAGYVLDVLGVICIGTSSMIRGPVGGPYSGKRAADGSGRQGPRPGEESKTFITRRKRWFRAGVLFLIIGVVLTISGQELLP